MLLQFLKTHTDFHLAYFLKNFKASKKFRKFTRNVDNSSQKQTYKTQNRAITRKTNLPSFLQNLNNFLIHA